MPSMARRKKDGVIKTMVVSDYQYNKAKSLGTRCGEDQYMYYGCVYYKENDLYKMRQLEKPSEYLNDKKD